MIPILYEAKEDCCGCGACVNCCPKQAISMEEDELGFLYPKINESLCINCNQCKRVCAFQNITVDHTPLETFAAVSCDRKLAAKSASGGIFATLAKQVLEAGGVVCGAVFAEDWRVQHILIDDVEQLEKLQGSKYTQSDTGKTFLETRQALQAGKKVLYSGTPCQIAGLYGFLGKEDENLLTVDIICHGVPSNQMLLAYLKHMEQEEHGEVVSFTFRDKKIGWGINGSVDLMSNGKIKHKKLWQSASSYLYYFSKGWVYRENCYRCKYACSHRPADLTIGDYWGIEKVHPEYLKNGWDESEGISVIIVNTEKGQTYLKQLDGYIQLKPSKFEKAALSNRQLNRPSTPGKRAEIMEEYFRGGWGAVEKRYRDNVRIRRYSSQAKALLPNRMKRWMKSGFGRKQNRAGE